MPIFDWIVSGASILTTKMFEVLVTEIAKKQIASTEKSENLNKIINLYSAIGTAQAYSSEFMDLLDIFIEKHKSRKNQFNNNYNRDDFHRWDSSWAGQLGIVAIDIAVTMKFIADQVDGFGLSIEIYSPKIGEILSEFGEYARFDMIIPNLIVHSAAIPIPETVDFSINELMKADGSIVSIDELKELSQKIRDSIETLADAKKLIAEIVKKEFTLSEYMDLSSHDKYENHHFWSKKNRTNRKKFYNDYLINNKRLT